jgi:hypothetical protein
MRKNGERGESQGLEHTAGFLARVGAPARNEKNGERGESQGLEHTAGFAAAACAQE